TTANIQNPYLHPTVPTTYSVIVSDITGSCSDTSSIDITVQCPTCDQPGITLINPTCKDGTDGKIIVTPTFQLGSEQHTYTYSDSVTTTVLQTTPNVVAGMLDSIINIGAGAYTISLLDTNGCTKDTTVWLTEPDSVIITSTSLDQIVCIDGTAQVEATASSFNGGPFTYTWTDLLTNTVVPVSLPQNVTPTASPTTYSVFATDVLGCISKADSTVTVTHLPPLDASTTLLNAETTICQNTAVDINMSATGGSGTGYHYEWFTNNVSIGTGDVINVNPNASPTEYIGVAHDDCTTPADSITITVYWTGEIFPSIVKDREDSCFTDIPVMFTNTSTPSALIQTTEWTTSNGNSGTGNTFSSEFNGPGCFDVSLKMTTILGCEVDTTFPCFVNPHGYPDANFDMTPPITDLLNTEIDFNNLSTGTGPLSYVWDFNSGVLPDSTTEENPIYTFRDDSAGIYSVTLTVTDTNGCVDIAKGNVVINNTYLFYIPSSFTPNGDGLNDDFKAYGEGIELSNYTMSIFNRWGELMFQTNNLSNGWDGTYKGKPVKAGVYIWKIKAKEEAGTVIHKNHGQITIAR
ncbi:MAG: gliding motility-associated C-terminal domain-containing protein, partial [Vicingaceae bacterium]